MFSMDQDTCPVCGGFKAKLIGKEMKDESGEANIYSQSQGWHYTPAPDEFIIACYCTECGVQFVINTN